MTEYYKQQGKVLNDLFKFDGKTISHVSVSKSSVLFETGPSDPYIIDGLSTIQKITEKEWKEETTKAYKEAGEVLNA